MSFSCFKRLCVLGFGGSLALAACGDDDATSPNIDHDEDAGADSSVFQEVPDPGSGAFWITVSGEDLAVNGYDWTPSSLADGDPPAFVDGWAIHFDHVIVTVDKLRINADPDKDEGNPTNLGALVASADGPWAVDVSIGGNIPGKSGSPDEKTVAIAAFKTQSSGAAFNPSTRYAFSYDFVAASPQAKIVNLDSEGLALYEQAKANGWAMIFQGTATYKGPSPDAASVYAKIPNQVKFTFGMKNPTSYINCRNTDLQAVGGEFPRGIQANPNRSTIVQITLHTDHVFWDTLNVEGTPLHFDPIAAHASTFGSPSTPGEVTLADLANVDITGFTTKTGEQLPWRSLVADYTAPAGQMRYESNGTSFTNANSFASYLEYTATSGGHMNADGECEVRNNYTP